jgi:signal transduction histidine kinase
MGASGDRNGWLGRLLAALNPWAAVARAEAEARQANRRLREALDVLPEGIVFLDAEGRYVHWNRAYAEIYHGSADLFRVGRPLAETLRIGVGRGDYPAAVGREEEWLAERLALLRNPTGERHVQQIKDGRWVMIEERATADGGVIGLRVDITDMKAQADALEEALARAEAAGRAKSEFLANMSHELRTPLNGVIGLGEVLARSPLGVSQQGLVRELLASAARLDALLRDLFDFNSLEAGKIEAARAPFRPAETVRAAARAFEAAVEAKGLTLSVEIAAGAEGEALGDPHRLGQILEQLLDNALKFTAEGGVALRLSADPQEASNVWRFEVIDTGVGFDAAEAERLFGDFEMGDASATREHGGAGLGLAICRRLAILMGGHIEAHGAPGEGARFVVTLTLPRQQRAAA